MQHTSTIFHLLRGAPHEHLPDDSPERFGPDSIQTREGGDVVKGVCPSPSSSVASTSEIPIIPAQLRRPPGLVVEQEGKQGDKEDSEMIIKQEGKHTAFVPLDDSMLRQDFLLRLTRAFMKFGAPAHRIPDLVDSAALAINTRISCIQIPGAILISFNDSSSLDSSFKIVRQDAVLQLGYLLDLFVIYEQVLNAEASTFEAFLSLNVLMQRDQYYRWWQLVLFEGARSASVCSLAFAGSFADTCVCFVLGAFLGVVRTTFAKSESFLNVFEIFITAVVSFVAAALAQTQIFCYTAVAASSIISTLPVFIMLIGTFEFTSRNILSGAIRLCYGVAFFAFLGFGLSIGSTFYEKITGNTVHGADDVTCSLSHNVHGPWYQRPPSKKWEILTTPIFSLATNFMNHLPAKRKELPISVLISSVGWTCLFFVNLRLPNQPALSSAASALTVGFLANMYSRFLSGNAFVIMIAGIFLQLPSGLGKGGLFTFVLNSDSGLYTSYLSSFETGLQVVFICVGFLIGLGLAVALAYPLETYMPARATTESCADKP